MVSLGYIAMSAAVNVGENYIRRCEVEVQAVSRVIDRVATEESVPYSLSMEVHGAVSETSRTVFRPRLRVNFGRVAMFLLSPRHRLTNTELMGLRVLEMPLLFILLFVKYSRFVVGEAVNHERLLPNRIYHGLTRLEDFAHLMQNLIQVARLKWSRLQTGLPSILHVIDIREQDMISSLRSWFRSIAGRNFFPGMDYTGHPFYSTLLDSIDSTDLQGRTIQVVGRQVIHFIERQVNTFSDFYGQVENDA